MATEFPSRPTYADEFKLIQFSFPYPYVLHLQLNRAPVNAFSRELWAEYDAAFQYISQDNQVRVVVVSSALQRLFCGGIDVTILQTPPEASDGGRKGLLVRSITLDIQRITSSAERCPYPVIAATHGMAVGLAIDLIATCDIRWAAEDTKFCIKEAAVGLAADAGTLARLPKITGNSSLLHELALTARNFTATEAKDLGLISKIVPGSRDEVVRAALDLGRRIAEMSPIATLGTKRYIAHARDHSIEDSLEYQATWNMGAHQAKDMYLAANAVLRKEKLSFPPLGSLPPKKPSSKL
ncbi:ClpP/crotonase [Amylostereum chailletii]|nr:ClpP/crotonase [Amylostereum chailletii]